MFASSFVFKKSKLVFWPKIEILNKEYRDFKAYGYGKTINKRRKQSLSNNTSFLNNVCYSFFHVNYIFSKFDA